MLVSHTQCKQIIIGKSKQSLSTNMWEHFKNCMHTQQHSVTMLQRYDVRRCVYLLTFSCYSTATQNNCIRLNIPTKTKVKYLIYSGDDVCTYEHQLLKVLKIRCCFFFVFLPDSLAGIKAQPWRCYTTQIK